VKKGGKRERNASSIGKKSFRIENRAEFPWLEEAPLTSTTINIMYTVGALVIYRLLGSLPNQLFALIFSLAAQGTLPFFKSRRLCRLPPVLLQPKTRELIGL
jgi:hypothetical protein